jgi:competence protein ComFC
MLKSVAPFLYSETHSQRCIGCDRRASDLLCRAYFEALPQIGRPVCARCGMPAAFETYVCDERKGVDFSFESARAHLRYTGVGKLMVYSLKYRDYTRVVDRLAVPLMLSALDDQSRLDAIVPVPLLRPRLGRRGFNQAQLLAQGVASEKKAPVSDTIQVVRKTQGQVELSAAERRRTFRVRTEPEAASGAGFC